MFPDRNIYEMQKAFKLRFNGLLLEEDVHVFPTSPPSRYNPPPTPKGILRRETGSPPPPAEQTGCPSKASSSDSSVDEAEAKLARKRSANGQLPSPIVRLEGTAALPSSLPSSDPGSGPGSPQKSWYNATSSDNLQSYSSSAQRVKSSEAKKQKERENGKENGALETASLNPYSYGGRAQDGRNTLTAQDCMRNIMMDLRATSTGEDEKCNWNGRTSSSSSSWSYSGNPGYSAPMDTDHSDPSHRLLYRVGYADAEEKENEKEKDPYEDLGSLSLHDLAALPLHFEKTADHLDSKIDSGYVVEHSPSGPSGGGRQGCRDTYRVDHGDGAYDEYSRNRYISSSNRNARESNSSSSSKRTSSHSYEATWSGSDEVEKKGNLLASFHRLGQEGAVRVQYSSLLLPPSASFHAKAPHSDCQGSAYNDKERTLAISSSVRSTDCKSSNDFGAETGNDRRADREKEKEKPLRTYRSLVQLINVFIILPNVARYFSVILLHSSVAHFARYRHGSPAPFKVSSRVLSAPQYPSPSSSATQRGRASSPSLARRDRDRGSSPGPGSASPTPTGDSDRCGTE
jgi:hypothetical protein